MPGAAAILHGSLMRLALTARPVSDIFKNIVGSVAASWPFLKRLRLLNGLEKSFASLRRIGGVLQKLLARGAVLPH
jgi:hypothetical protein